MTIALDVTLKTIESKSFQQLPRDMANVNAWKNMFDPYIESTQIQRHDNVESGLIQC